MNFMNSVKTLDNMRYQPHGTCIYCGSMQSLEKEHIIPFALSGTAEFPDSTCRKCATITGGFEQKVLRGPMWPVRIFRDLRSRTKHRDAPDQYTLTIVKDGKELHLNVPLEDVPLLLHFPVFAPPAFLEPNGYERGIIMNGAHTISFGPTPQDIARKLGAESITLTQTHEPVAFARMIGKIAYAFAAAENKLRLLKGSPFVIPAILGHTDDIGRWVSTLTEPTEKFEKLLHRILMHEDRDKNLLIAEVHLFSDSEAPRYGVILGELA